jgi:hypothetical protein
MKIYHVMEVPDVSFGVFMAMKEILDSSVGIALGYGLDD